MSPERMGPTPEEMETIKFNTMAEKILSIQTPLDFEDKLKSGDSSYVGRFISELKTWSHRDLFLLSKAIETLGKQRRDDANRRNEERLRQMQTENAARKAAEESERLAKRNISDDDINERAEEVVRNLTGIRMRSDEYIDLIRNYFSTGNHSDYPGYSGEDLRALANTVERLNNA